MIANNALVSTTHCTLIKGEGRVGVVIKDTSTNGTLLNGKKMVKGQEVCSGTLIVQTHNFYRKGYLLLFNLCNFFLQVQLAHGDVIRIVFNKTKPSTSKLCSRAELHSRTHNSNQVVSQSVQWNLCVSEWSLCEVATSLQLGLSSK